MRNLDYKVHASSRYELFGNLKYNVMEPLAPVSALFLLNLLLRYLQDW